MLVFQLCFVSALRTAMFRRSDFYCSSTTTIFVMAVIGFIVLIAIAIATLSTFFVVVLIVIPVIIIDYFAHWF